MDPTLLFILQTMISLIVFALAARWYLAPRLARLPLEEALVPLVWVHALRNVGMTVLAPGTVDPAVPEVFKVMIGYGDLSAVILAILSLLALRAKMNGAILLVWLFNIVGTADLINAGIQGVRFGAFLYPLGAGWLIVTMYVPALLVSSVMIFSLLLTRKGREAIVEVA
jgi:hypothetical protein